MYNLYILQSLTSGRTYTGITDNLERRLKEHNAGRHPYTKRYLPWEIIYTELLNSRIEARGREKYFKSAAGRRLLAKLIADIK
ncbi:MAG: GIY-YIG nuclease family protein [Candidatus Colwellbacteria bacterium]|nr:GIY-YIG nuclease family protein [Candidatus Colwellbacteria bacterium]